MPALLFKPFANQSPFTIKPSSAGQVWRFLPFPWRLLLSSIRIRTKVKTMKKKSLNFLCGLLVLTLASLSWPAEAAMDDQAFFELCKNGTPQVEATIKIVAGVGQFVSDVWSFLTVINVNWEGLAKSKGGGLLLLFLVGGLVFFAGLRMHARLVKSKNKHRDDDD